MMPKNRVVITRTAALLFLVFVFPSCECLKQKRDPAVLVERAKRLMEWNTEKLVRSSNLKQSDIEELFAAKFIIKANERTYEANYETYFEFLEKFRSNIVSIKYEVQEYVASDSTVTIPLVAKVERPGGEIDIFDAIMFVKYDDSEKIVHWQEVYSVRE